jgi:sugar/nucleoside kinase (ribokinase family)
MKSFKFDVASLGNAIVDILSCVEDEFLIKNHLQKGSYQALPQEEINALYNLIPPATEQSGGSAANTVAGLASLGAKTTYMGKVHDDEFGHIFLHDLISSGVHCPSEPSLEGAGTGRSIILITPDAERTMNTYLGASIDITPVDVQEDLILNSKVFYTEAYLWEPFTAREAVMKAIRICKGAGNQFAFTLSDIACVKRYREDLIPFVKEQVDILIANEFEIKELYQTDLTSAVERVRDQGITAALTLGKEGSLIIQNKQIYQVHREPALQVVDTTGAGDIYASGFLFGITQGLDMPTTGKIASIAAAEVISHLGSRPCRSLATCIKERLK